MSKMSEARKARSGRPRWRGARGFGAREDGVTAVEFGLVAMPFLFGLMAIFEVALTFLGGQTLQMAVDDAAREVRTGEFHSGGSPTRASFVSAVCSKAILIFDCEARLRVDMRSYDSFEDVERLPVLNDEDGFKDDDMQFEAGEANSIIVARAFYKRRPIAPMVTSSSSQLDDGSILMSAALVFQNEPF